MSEAVREMTRKELVAENNKLRAENERLRSAQTDREALAALCHEQWSGWMGYLFKRCDRLFNGLLVIPEWAEKRWKRQVDTKYADLTEFEKDSDRMEADRFIALIVARTALGKDGQK